MAIKAEALPTSKNHVTWSNTYSMGVKLIDD